MSNSRTRLTERERFSYYLRTGRILADEPEDTGTLAPLESKFNPWHDPENGRFTFAPGGPRSLSHVSTSWGKHGLKPGIPQPSQETHGNARRSTGTRSSSSSNVSAISLSRTHRDFLSQNDRHAPKPNTKSTWDESEFPDKADFKAQYVSGYRDAIKAAAERYDLPPELVASIAYTEVGGDGLSNDIAYSLRAESGRKIPEELGITEDGREIIKDLNRPRSETSFGPYNIQQRRAAEILDYGDINIMSETARRRLIPTIQEPVPATFMLAKHLSDLRDQDFPSVAGKDLTADQLLVVAMRYNLGPDMPKSYIWSNRKDGMRYLKSWKTVSKLIK